MRPTWLIEAGVYGAEAEPLLAEIRRQGMQAASIPPQSLLKGSTALVDGHPLSEDTCVIGYGTFPFARQIQLHQRWVPGAWCNPDTLDCSVYFGYFGKYLLNQHYAIMPGVEAIRQRDWLFAVFGRNDTVFARPSTCQKTFVGRCILKDAFATALSPTRYDPTTLVVVSSPKPIAREWRLVIIGTRVIAGSQYAENGTRAIAPGVPDEVQAFATAMLSEVHWRPDPIFMLDICESDNGLGLVELNGFSCSWLYRCDLKAVVAGASDLAGQNWSPRVV